MSLPPLAGASIFHLARGLHKREFFTTKDILGAVWKQTYFRVVGVEDPEHVAQTRASALSFIKGHTVAELEELGYATLWIPDAGGDIFGAVDLLLDATSKATIATGILNIWVQDAAEVARETLRRAPGGGEERS